MYRHSIARVGVSSRSSSASAKNGRCRTAPGPPSTPPPPAGPGAEASLLLPPTVLLSSPLLCRRSYHLTHVWPRTIKSVQTESSGKRQVPLYTWRGKKFAPFLHDDYHSRLLRRTLLVGMTQKISPVSFMEIVCVLRFLITCRWVVLHSSSHWPESLTSRRGHEWKRLKRCDKHFTVENQVWQVSTLFTSVLRIPTKSCGFFGKNTMTAAAFWSPLLSLNNPGSHRCYHFGSQRRNEKYEETNLVWLLIRGKDLSIYFDSLKQEHPVPVGILHYFDNQL